MQIRSPSSAPGSYLLITRKFRGLILQSVSQNFPAAILMAAPTRGRYVAIDLANAPLRGALESATKPYLSRRPIAFPAALVGSARKVIAAIAEYERRNDERHLSEDK